MLARCLYQIYSALAAFDSQTTNTSAPMTCRPRKPSRYLLRIIISSLQARSRSIDIYILPIRPRMEIGSISLTKDSFMKLFMKMRL
jgi:hypothetical protein